MLGRSNLPTLISLSGGATFCLSADTWRCIFTAAILNIDYPTILATPRLLAFYPEDT